MDLKGMLLTMLALVAIGCSKEDGHVEVVAQPEGIECGTVEQSGEVILSGEVINRSQQSVEISGVRTSCPCAEFTLEHKRLEPGQRSKYELRLSFSHEPDFQGGLSITIEGLSRDSRVVFETTARVIVK